MRPAPFSSVFGLWSDIGVADAQRPEQLIDASFRLVGSAGAQPELRRTILPTADLALRPLMIGDREGLVRIGPYAHLRPVVAGIFYVVLANQLLRRVALQRGIHARSGPIGHRIPR